MSWSEISPQIRLVILVALVVVGAFVLWSFVVAPLRASAATAGQDAQVAVDRLEQIERQIEAIPPATQGEPAAWQASNDQVFALLGPETDLPVFVETVTRAADALGVEAYVTIADSQAVQPTPNGKSTEQVIGTVRGARRIEFSILAFGDYDALGRFVGEIGRLGWVAEFGPVELWREFPEIVADMTVGVYFRANGDPVASATGRPMPQMGGQGGRP
ncbi:MAG: hypothetical protein GKS06_05075 [Acidobacteria bacterium]|nr:hypothetical protein [Acidobacteriota bacterium]